MIFATISEKKSNGSKISSGKNYSRLIKGDDYYDEINFTDRLGRFGRHIAMKLDELNHQVMAIDRNEERVDANSSLCYKRTDW